MSPERATRDLDLYELLPAVYRIEDSARGGTLRGLMEILSEHVRVIKEDVDGLYDDLFIETCADWVVPYIGDLVANNALHEGVIGRRADVANTIRYRRRKGVLPMLEELARDVTRWGARAVAFFELLGWNQNSNHLRYERSPEARRARFVYPPAVDRVGTVNVRNGDLADRIDGPFDECAHTVDVRPISTLEGWHAIKNVGFFLWRLRSYPLERVVPAASGGTGRRFRFSPFGNDTALFVRPLPVDDAAEASAEVNVPGPIRPRAFHSARRDYYPQSVEVFDENGRVLPETIMCKDLGTWSDPPPDRVAVDVRLGRLLFGTAVVPDPAAVRVSFSYGFPADLGGGAYRRERPPADATSGPDLIAAPQLANDVLRVAADGSADYATLEAAVAAWDPANRITVIQIEDSETYPLVGGAIEISHPASTRDTELVVQAADAQRPVLVGDITVAATDLRRLVLDGVVVSGQVALNGPVEGLVLRHTTLVPGIAFAASGAPTRPRAASIRATAVQRERLIELDHSVVGRIRVPAEMHEIRIRDSIVAPPRDDEVVTAIAGNVDATNPGPVTIVERSTIAGPVFVRALELASDAIFTGGTLRVERRQVGCMRFCSYEPEGARTPRRYRCQPDLVLERATAEDAETEGERVRARFTARDYGHPAYLQLALDCAAELTAGASNGAEMGVYNHLQQPQRIANLELRLEEYLPVGLAPGLIFVT